MSSSFSSFASPSSKSEDLLLISYETLGETSSNGFTYYWSGMSNDHHVKSVTIIVSSRLQLSVVEVTPVDEYIMGLKLKHSLGFMSCCSVRSY